VQVVDSNIGYKRLAHLYIYQWSTLLLSIAFHFDSVWINLACAIPWKAAQVVDLNIGCKQLAHLYICQSNKLLPSIAFHYYLNQIALGISVRLTPY
jgi:hypothetical protein